jgi:hypothetical protein
MMDVAVLILFFLHFSIVQGTGLHYVTTSHSIFSLICLFGVNILSFWLFQTYSGIIKALFLYDAVKLLQISVLVDFFVNLIFY